MGFDEQHREALKRWYGRDECLDKIRVWNEAKKWFDLEQYIRQDGLMPLVFRDGLPDYLVKEDGAALFSTDDLHPGNNRDGWAEAVEIGWSVVEEKLGIKRDEVEGKMDAFAEADWERFMASVEERRRQRGKS